MSENPNEKPGRRVGTNLRLIPGNPGNSGGKKGRSGRPPSVIREACALAFDRRIKFLKDVIDGKTGELVQLNGVPVLVDGKPVVIGADISERLKAMDLLGKYGGLQKTETETTIKRPHREAVEQVRRELGLAS